jgi:hypothetical protein
MVAGRRAPEIDQAAVTRCLPLDTTAAWYVK